MHQQRLSIGVRANPARLKEAELEARKIGVLLESSDFDWAPYLKTPNSAPLTCANWIERFQLQYMTNGGTATTWEGDYWKVFRHLLPDAPLEETTKTGLRQVFPCYPEWAEQWQLDKPILPNVNLACANDKIGHSVTEYLSPKLPFVPYDLRHAWAVRTLEFGFPIELAARQMGHRVAVHERTYHKWITAKH